MRIFRLLFALLVLLEGAYIALARKLHIGVTDEAGRFTPVGGGVIFIIAAVLAALISPDCGRACAVVVGGGAVLAAMSYADDIVRLSPRLRLVVQTAVMAAVLYPIAEGGRYDLYVLAIISCVGYINASNFMDGTNGMLALYSIVVLGTLWYVGRGIIPAGLVYIDLYVLMAVAVFAIFNFRNHALVFSGDVGSITAGFFIAVSLCSMMIDSGDLSPALFVGVFLTDTFCTFVSRLLNGEAVLQPHRKHLYQLLVRAGYPQLGVAAVYAGIQTAINAGWIAVPARWHNLYGIFVTSGMLTAYVWLTLTIKRRLTSNPTNDK